MTERTVTQAGRDKGRILLWLMILLSVLLLGFVTVFTARHNPLYSDRDAYGISKYKFIEACKERLHEPNELSLNLQGQAVPLSAFASTRWVTGAMQTVRYNGYPAMRISAASPWGNGGEIAVQP